jgi:hypothetical protein
MATGLIQQTNIASTALTSIYSGVPAGKTATVNILLCNLTNSAATVSIALTPTTSAGPTDAQWIEKQTVLGAYEVMERGGIVLGAGNYIYAKCDSTPAGATVNLATTITGYEV